MEEKRKITLKGVVTNLDAIITGTTLTLCVILVNANIIFRRFLNSPLQWSEEVVTSLFVWTVFIGSAYAHRKHSHLGVDILVNVLPGKSKPIVQDIMSVVELLVLIMLTVVSSQYVYSLIFSRGVMKIAMTDLLRVPKWWTGIAVPIGFGLSTLYQVRFLLKDRLHIIKDKEAAAE
nr:TRAP transporter small permease [uncultured Oscillibacter sp.]